MPRLRDLLELGIRGLRKSLVRRGIDVRKLFDEYAVGEERTLVLRLQPRSGRAEEFGLYLDTATWEIGLTEGHAIPEPTVRVTVLDEDFMWELAARRHTLFSAYFTRRDLPIQLEGAYRLRDALVLDRLFDVINDCLLADGIDLAAILAPGQR